MLDHRNSRIGSALGDILTGASSGVSGGAAAEPEAAAGAGPAAPAYGMADYWEKRYGAQAAGSGSAAGQPAGTFEWYLEWPTLQPHVDALGVDRSQPVLNVGCGNSTLAEDMARDGFSRVVSIDISQSAVDGMAARATAAGLSDALTYQQMDASKMDFAPGTFAAAVDKGTLDAVLSGGADSLPVATAILGEVNRVLQPGGRFLLVSSIEQTMYEPLLSAVFDAVRCTAVETGYGSTASRDRAQVAFVYTMRRGGSAAMAAATEEEAQDDMERMLQEAREVRAMAEEARAASTKAGAELSSAARDAASARAAADSASREREALGRAVDDAASAMQREVQAAEEAALNEMHVSRSLADYARKKGREHGEVEVSAAAGGGVQWSWAQTRLDVTVTVPVPEGTTVHEIRCKICKQEIRVGLKGHEPLLQGRLLFPVNKTDSTWALVDRMAVSLELVKTEPGQFWERVFEADAAGAVGAKDGLVDYGPVADRLEAEHDAATAGATGDVPASTPSADKVAAHPHVEATLTVTSSDSVARRGFWDVAFEVRRAETRDASAFADVPVATDRDYIGLFKAGEGNVEEYEDLEYTEGELVGSVRVRAPPRDGKFEFVYVIGEGPFAGRIAGRSRVVSVAPRGSDGASGASPPPAPPAAVPTPVPTQVPARAAAPVGRPAYLLERQVHISVYQLYVPIPASLGAAGAVEPALRGSGRALSLTVARARGTPHAELNLLLPDEVEPASCRLTLGEDGSYLSARVPFKFPGSGVRDRPDSIVTREELRSLGGADLRCRSCEAQLVAGDGARRVSQLPSGYWMDLSDHWVCHPDETNEALRKGEITAEASRCMVGEAHILMHGSDFLAGAVALSDLSDEATAAVVDAVRRAEADGFSLAAERAVRMVECARCAFPLGTADVSHEATFHALVEGDDVALEDAGAADVTLWKDRLVSRPARAGGAGAPEPVDDVLLRYSVASRLCIEMLEASIAHSQYHFIVTEVDGAASPLAAASVRMLLTLVSWDTSIEAEGEAADARAVRGAALAPALKVRFLASPDAATVEEWRAKHAPHPFSMLHAECTEVVAALEQAAGTFPATFQRNAQETFGWPLAYLFLARPAQYDDE